MLLGLSLMSNNNKQFNDQDVKFREKNSVLKILYYLILLNSIIKHGIYG